jgi:alcohol dehydrogenase (cytochrome c)
MRHPLVASVLSTILASAIGAMAHGAPAPAVPAPKSPTKTLKAVPNFTTVTDQALRAPKASDWVMYRGNYQGWGYSPLEQINKTNVRTLQLAWSRVMGPGPNQATPIIYEGVMYLTSPSDLIQAIDAATGDLLWEYKHPLPPEEMFQNDQGQKKRGLAVYGNRVFFVTWDNMVVSLDARTGEQVWQTDRGGTFHTTNSSGPIVANGVVVAGSTCNTYGGCYATGHDAETGRELWRNHMIPRPGEPGDETWAGSPFESRWHTGVWGFITYDPGLDLVYYGSSGVSPASEAERKMPGATMAGTDTRFAVRPKTGEIVWRHQVLPRDNWDQECTFEMMVIDTQVNPDARAQGMLAVNPNARRGMRKTLTGIPCKTGIAWSFDAANGEFLWARETTEQNLVARIDERGAVTVNEDVVLKEVGKTYEICPTYAGGRDWPMGAYNPKSNLMFMPLSNMCISTTARTDRGPPNPSFGYNTTNVGRFSTGKDKVGRIDAINVETGRIAWSWETRVSNYSSLLTTGSGLLFNGSMDRYLRAFDADTGRVIWETRLPSQTVGAPVTYSVNGRQYVAIAAGGGNLANMQIGLTPEADTASGSNAVYVFALPQ